jgi:hypothetical protein
VNNENLNSCSLGNICSYLTNNIGPATIELNAEGCNTENEITDDCAPVGINHLEQAQFNTYPNPTSGILSVQGFEGSAKVELYTVQGQFVYTWENCASPLNLDLSCFDQGVYILQVKSNAFETIKRIVLQP